MRDPVKGALNGFCEGYCRGSRLTVQGFRVCWLGFRLGFKV